MRTLSRDAVMASMVATDTSGSLCAISWQQILREAKLYWPRNTAKQVSRITGASLRTSYRWLANDVEPPASAVVSVILALRTEYVARGRIFEQLDLGL